MPRTRECDYCGADIEPGTGTMFVRKNGTTVHFCSSKCEKNADLGREARDLSWTEAGGASSGGETDSDAEPDTADEAAPDESDVAEDEPEPVDADATEDDADAEDETADAEDEKADAEETETEEPTEADA